MRKSFAFVFLLSFAFIVASCKEKPSLKVPDSIDVGKIDPINNATIHIDLRIENPSRNEALPYRVISSCGGCMAISNDAEGTLGPGEIAKIKVQLDARALPKGDFGKNLWVVCRGDPPISNSVLVKGTIIRSLHSNAIRFLPSRLVICGKGESPTSHPLFLHGPSDLKPEEVNLIDCTPDVLTCVAKKGDPGSVNVPVIVYVSSKGDLFRDNLSGILRFAIRGEKREVSFDYKSEEGLIVKPSKLFLLAAAEEQSAKRIIVSPKDESKAVKTIDWETPPAYPFTVRLKHIDPGKAIIEVVPNSNNKISSGKIEKYNVQLNANFEDGTRNQVDLIVLYQAR